MISATKHHQKWSKRFGVDHLEELYLGDYEEGKYKVNLFYPSIQTRLSMMTVDKPEFRVEAKPQRADDAGSNIEARAKLREDTANCYVSTEQSGFVSATSLGVQEAHVRFAVCEVVYSNDFIDNPMAGKPILDEDGKETDDKHPPKLPDDKNTGPHEWVYFKRIPSKNWRVSLNAGNNLETADWCGYFEWHFSEDIKRNPNYSNTSSLKATGKIDSSYEDVATPDEENQSKQGMVKLWKIWSIREKKRYDFVDGGDKFLREEEYDIFPFAVLKFHEILDDFYPLPPTFNWVPPQEFLNETRAAQAAYLGQAYPKWLYRDSAITETEMNKLEERKPGLYAKVEGAQPFTEVVAPVQQGGMDASFWRNVPQSKEDFIQISAVSSEQRGVPDSNTATQANIVDVNSKRREVKDATKVAAWMSKLAKILLETLRKRMTLPFVVFTNVDPTGPNAQMEAANVIKTWKEITAPELGDENYEVTVDVQSLSPLSEQEQQQQWGQVMGFLRDPMAMAVLSQSRLLVTKVLGFKSDRDIREVQAAFQGAIQLQQQQAEQMAKAKQAQGGPPAMDQLLQQLTQGMQQ